jgi:hypothetical protein
MLAGKDWKDFQSCFLKILSIKNGVDEFYLPPLEKYGAHVCTLVFHVFMCLFLLKPQLFLFHSETCFSWFFHMIKIWAMHINGHIQTLNISFFWYTIISYHLSRKRYNIIYIISWKEWYDRISYIISKKFEVSYFLHIIY